MSERDHFISLRFQCLFDLGLAHGSPDLSLDLVHFGSICLQATNNRVPSDDKDCRVPTIKRTSPQSYPRNNRCLGQARFLLAPRDWLLPLGCGMSTRPV